MNKKSASLTQDVESLLKDSVTAEATNQVWSRFEKALGELDEGSLVLLKEHFAGTSLAEISRRSGLSEDKLQCWLTRTKRQLVRHLRGQCPVRQ